RRCALTRSPDMAEPLLLYGLGAAAAALTLPALKTRLELSRAKHPSLTGHVRMASRIAKLIPFYGYGEDRFFRSDRAAHQVEARGRVGWARLSALSGERYARSFALTAEAREGISDLQFTSAYRVPFQYSAYVRRHLPVGAFVQATAGVNLIDLDGNRFYDLT